MPSDTTHGFAYVDPGDALTDYPPTMQALAERADDGSVPAGALLDYAGAAAPAGWLLCDGASYLRATYPALFAAIGVAFGSADGTHFNVPDSRGRVTVGLGSNAAVSTLGNSDGVSEANRRPKHRHTPHTHTYQGGLPNNVAAAAGAYFVNDATFPATSAVDGGSGVATDSLDAPAYLVVNRIIKK